MNVSSSQPAQGNASHLAAAYAGIRTSVLAEAAEKLGISLDQLRQQLEAGTPLAQIAVAGVARGMAPAPPPPPADPPVSQVDLVL